MAKRFALVLLVLMLVATATACGKKDDTPAPPAPVTPGEATGLDGAALLQEKCTVCHSLDVVYAEEQDAVGWAAIIDTMIAKGAEVTDEEAAAIAEYLSLQ